MGPGPRAQGYFLSGICFILVVPVSEPVFTPNEFKALELEFIIIDFSLIFRIWDFELLFWILHFGYVILLFGF